MTPRELCETGRLPPYPESIVWPAHDVWTWGRYRNTERNIAVRAEICFDLDRAIQEGAS